MEFKGCKTMEYQYSDDLECCICKKKAYLEYDVEIDGVGGSPHGSPPDINAYLDRYKFTCAGCIEKKKF